MQSSGIQKRSKISLDLYHLLFVRLPQVYRRQDALIHTVVGITLLVAIVIRICNYFGQNFEPLNFPTAFATAIPGLVVVWIVGVLAYSRYPKSGLFLSSFSQVFLFIMVCGYALASAITTPFTPIDPYLLKIDQILHFSTTGLMAWTYHQPWLTHCLYFCYDTWFFQLALTPLLLALYKDQAEIDVFILATFVSFLIGSLIYYFCPTIAPAGLLHSQYFMHSQYELVTRFTQIHQHLPVTVYEGGMIAFPSFHIINSLLILYAWRHYRLILIPLIVIDVFLVFATLALGYHYLADVVAGAILAYLSIKLAKYALKKFLL